MRSRADGIDAFRWKLPLPPAVVVHPPTSLGTVADPTKRKKPIGGGA